MGVKRFLFIVLLFLGNSVVAQLDENTTPTYEELIRIYQELADAHAEIELYAMGDSDYGLPIYLCVINGAQDSIKTFDKAKSGTTILINNGIHPGEPDGINACLIWINDWIKSGKNTKNLPVVGIIPSYNVGGMKNRSSSSRANQEGPEEYGFRGNAQNLDLNRDFIKMDSKNMFTFARIFHGLDPDVFMDTHVSNGADYQYTLTYIASVKERMAPSVAKLTHGKLIPYLTDDLKKHKTDLISYVSLVDDVPEKGMYAFDDLPRYSMGYASLFNTISFTVETHMLKPFPERTQATLRFLKCTIVWISEHSDEIEQARTEAFQYDQSLTQFPFDYELTDKKDSLLFKGFEHSYPMSEVTGHPRLRYHQDQPFEKYIPFFQTYAAKDTISVPSYYVVGRQCDEVIERLRANRVAMIEVDLSNVGELSQYAVTSFESGRRPYEGHFLHSKIEVETLDAVPIMLKKGDMIVPTDQRNVRFILSVLEPEMPDSYFAWNFFDSYVQQKEYFSSYVFEDKAVEILQNDPELRARFERKQLMNEEFRNSPGEQLAFIYENSEFYEPTHNRLPIFIMK